MQLVLQLEHDFNVICTLIDIFDVMLFYIEALSCTLSISSGKEPEEKELDNNEYYAAHPDNSNSPYAARYAQQIRRAASVARLGA
jgi:hypothetical protein